MHWVRIFCLILHMGVTCTNESDPIYNHTKGALEQQDNLLFEKSHLDF